MSATAAVKNQATSSPVSGRIPVISWCALAVITLLLYWPTVRGLLGDWWNDPNYSHGPLIPLVIAYFVYRQWGELRREPLAPRMGIGLSVVVASQLMFLAGYLGAEFFLQRSSIVVLAAGLVLCVAGAHHLRRLLLPLLLFALSIPLPTLLLNFITMPLQLLASAGAELILRSCGLAVYRAGNILRLQTQTLNVSEACSGIRSLTSLVTLAVILVSFVRLRWPVRVAVVASAAGVAIVANALRVTGTGLIGHYFGLRAATGSWHWFEGWFVFIVSYLMLTAELKIVRRFCSCEPEEHHA
jgi:exosortase